MIETVSRDPISLWNDLAVGWVSGQERSWFDEQIGSDFYSYNNLLVCKWDYLSFELEGEKIRRSLALKHPVSHFFNEGPRFREKVQFVESYRGSTFCFDVLKKSTGERQGHVHSSKVEFPREFFKLLSQIDVDLRHWKVESMLPVAFHITALRFSRTTLPLLLPLLGRGAFMDEELSQFLNKDYSNMKRILSPSYPKKMRQRVWKHVNRLMGRFDADEK